MHSPAHLSGPHHQGPLTHHHILPPLIPLFCLTQFSHQIPSQPLPHSRHGHIMPLSHYNVSLHHPPTPPCPTPIHPFLSHLLRRSSEPLAHDTHYIVFHTDFLVPSSLSISTSFLNPNTHSLISVIFLLSHTLPSFTFSHLL